ncbi:capsid cement protein [Nocardia sp. R16R-3T]
MADLQMNISASVTAGQLVEITASKTVAPTNGPTAAWLGVTAYPRELQRGATVTVHVGSGTRRVVASGPLTAGALLVAAPDGKVAVCQPDTDHSLVVGIAFADAEDGEWTDVVVMR